MRIHNLITKSDVLETALWLAEHKSQGYLKRTYGVFKTPDRSLQNPYIVWYRGYPKLREIIQSFAGLHGERLAIELKRDCFLGKVGEVVGFVSELDKKTNQYVEVGYKEHRDPNCSA